MADIYGNQIPPMNFSDLFTAQNMGMGGQLPTPMGANQSQAIAMPAQMPMAGPQNVQMPPELRHIGDVINQYTQNKQDQQDNSGLVQQILSNRMQPTMQDTSRSVFQNAISPPTQYISPDEVMANRYREQLAPYTQGLGLATASAGLTKDNLANSITAQTGLPAAQAEISQKNALASYYGTALQRDLAEKQFEYANDPAKIQARAMADYMSGMNGNSPSQPQNGFSGAQQGNNQPRFNPMGAMIAKQFGLDNMQIGANGQPEMIPGVVTPGQKEQDTNFAQSYETYTNAGGALRTQNSINTIDDIINQLQSGKLATGGTLDAASMGPNGEETWTGRLLNSPILVARTRVANSILPQAKALFGARVTNFDAQSLINSQGLDPLADTQTNIAKLQQLKSAVIAGQNDLKNSGQYFSQHGTLAGYQPSSGQVQSSQAVKVQSPDGKIGTIDPAELQPALANGWKVLQ